MTIQELLANSSEKLSNFSHSPHSDSEILLGFSLNKDTNWIHKNPNLEINTQELEKFNILLKKRIQNTPIEHITNSKFFYENKFYVNENTLIPRPETELLVDNAINSIKESLFIKNFLNILEIGAGSGCISISIIDEILKYLKNNNNNFILNFYSTDISTKAIKVAKKNYKNIFKNLEIKAESRSNLTGSIKQKKHKVNIELINADIIKPILGGFSTNISKKGIDLLISNPPYIPTINMTELDEAVKKEPKIALDGGRDGIEIIKRIFYETKNLIIPNTSKYIIEIDSRSEQALIKTLEKDPSIKDYCFKNDLTNRTRFLEVTW